MAVQQQDVKIETLEWGEVIKVLDAAENAWANRDAPGAERNASVVLTMNPAKKFAERALLIRAKARIHLKDYGGAKADLNLLGQNLTISDPRHEEIAQLMAQVERSKGIR